MKTSVKLSLSLLLFANTNILFAQSDGFTEIIKTGSGDANKLTQAYLSPLFTGVGIGLNSGWYHSAKAKNLGRFDFKFMATAAIVPSENQIFDVRNIGLSNQTRLSNPNNFNTPTAFGNNSSGPQMDIYDTNNSKIGSFTLPSGSGFNLIPTPQLQITVGLIKNTDVSIRYSPKIGNDKYGRFSVLGFGAKHELTSLIFPGIVGKLVPIDIAVAFAYSQVNFERLISINEQLDESNSNKNLNQRVEGKFSGISADIILSKKLSVFTPFVSLNYNTSNTNVGIKGDFVIANPPTSSQAFTTITNPVSLQQTDLAALRGNIGFQIELAFFRLYSTYSISKYQAVTAGIGFGIGK